VDAAQAIRELMELSSQIEAAAVLGADGKVVASSSEDEHVAGRLASSGLELMAAASELGAQQEASRVEVELEGGALFVVREGAHTIVARTGSEPTAGLVVYDLRTSLRSIDEPAPKKRRASRAKKEDTA
jgi:predicted regulator of Ras-like GTPase activity (Roadblock/LC7/MglB family)